MSPCPRPWAPLPALPELGVYPVNARPRANTAALSQPFAGRPGLTSMELAMFRHSSMPGISSCSTCRSLQRSVMVPEEPEILREGGSGGQGHLGDTRGHTDSTQLSSSPASAGLLALLSRRSLHGARWVGGRESKKPNLVSRREPPVRGGWYQPKFCTLRTTGGQCPLRGPRRRGRGRTRPGGQRGARGVPTGRAGGIV